MTIRLARTSEWPQLQQLNNEVFVDNAQYDADLVKDWAMTSAGAHYFEELVHNPNKLCLVAEDGDGVLIGYLAASHLDFDYRMSRYLEINNMGVVPSARSKGVGKKLIAECMRWAESHGYQKVIVNSYFKNKKAVAFYKQNGFSEIDLSLERSVTNLNLEIPPAINKDRFLFIVAVHVFLIKDNQVLLLERANTGYMDGWFSIPAGHVDGKEEIWQAAQRELAEEVGLQVTKEHSPSHVMHRTKDGEERIDYFYLVKNWPGLPVNAEPEKCAQINWFPLGDLPQKMVPYVRFALSQIISNIVFSEYTEYTE